MKHNAQLVRSNTRTISALDMIKVAAIIFWFCISYCNGHGRLIEPPSRASAWRYGFSTPPDYNDHESYCGGFTRQWRTNEGRCGVCGDAWDLPEPRAHEHGGQWGVGVIVRRYSPGAEIPIRVELTASHMGYFEFRVCPNPDAKQSCLDKIVLPLLSGFPSIPHPDDLKTRFYPRNGSRIYEMRGQLPDIECEHCMLQWRYIAGNNWGMCPNGVGAVGCGPQEEFRACADIAISDKVETRPSLRPTTHSPSRPKATSTEHSDYDQNEEKTDNTALILGLLFLLLILLGFIIWLVYQSKYKSRIPEWKELLRNRFCQKYSRETETSISSNSNLQEGVIPTISTSKPTDVQTLPVPVAPPRNKRKLSHSVDE